MENSIRPWKSTHIFMFAAWFGLGTGLIEASMQAFRKFYLDRIIYLCRHFLWMTPLSDLVFFLAVGILLFILALLLPRWITKNIVLSSFSFLSVMSLYYFKPKISFWAAVLLAAGLAVTLVRVQNKYPILFEKIVRASLPIMFLVLVSISITMLVFFQY